jgi:hypothetical protein
MKIELRHLAPYLPFNLPLSRLNKDNQPKIIHMNNGNIMLPIEKPDRCKPILRPLSEETLQQEITLNGKTFVPLHALLEFSCFDLSKMEAEEIKSYAGQFTQIDLALYQDVEMLLEWHFDVFGLLETGRAIGINTVAL